MNNYYDLLGLTPDCTSADISAACYRLSQHYHPDLNGGDHTHAELYRQVVQAADVLRDPVRRAAYDHSLGLGGGAAAGPAAGAGSSADLPLAKEAVLRKELEEYLARLAEETWSQSQLEAALKAPKPQHLSLVNAVGCLLIIPMAFWALQNLDLELPAAAEEPVTAEAPVPEPAKPVAEPKPEPVKVVARVQAPKQVKLAKPEAAGKQPEPEPRELAGAEEVALPPVPVIAYKMPQPDTTSVKKEKNFLKRLFKKKDKNAEPAVGTDNSQGPGLQSFEQIH